MPVDLRVSSSRPISYYQAVIVLFNARYLVRVVGMAATLFALSSSAQIAGPGSPSSVNAALVKLFTGFPGFTARANLQVFNASHKEWLSLPMKLALLGNVLRADIDLTEARNEDLAASVGGLKQMGLAQVVSIVRPDKKLVYILFPGATSCMEVPIPKDELDAVDSKTRVEKTALGNETISGHPCVKNKTVVKGERGQLLVVTTWNATDLKDFPVQIESKDKENSSIIRFKDIQLSKPEAIRFEVPSTYARYKNQTELMLGLTRKALGSSK